MKTKQGSMFEKLQPIRRQFKPNRSEDFRQPAPSPMKWIGDGEDHINIWEHGETELGCILSPNYDLGLNHSIFGRFANMEAFWHYIQSEERDDRIRSMNGQTLKKFSKMLTNTRVTNFRAIIMDSHYQRIKAYKVLVKSMKESTLPFDCYYINDKSGIRMRPVYFKWFLRGMEEIRNALKEDREPNFSFLLDRPGTDIYEFVVPKTEKVAVVKEEKPQQTASLLSSVKQEVAEQQKAIEVQQDKEVEEDKPTDLDPEAAKNERFELKA